MPTEQFSKEFFGHDYGTRHKKKMAALRKKYKSRGYGLFWIIVEMLYEEDEHWMELSELTYLSISAQSDDPVPFIHKFVEDCINVFNVFIQEGNRFSTSRVLLNIDIRLGISKQRSEAGAIGAAKRWQKMANAIHVPESAIANDGNSMANHGKVKESKEKESKGYLRPKGLTAAFAADTEATKVLKGEYNQLLATLEEQQTETAQAWTAVKTFVQDKKPLFIEPYIDTWNIFALTYKLIDGPIRVTDQRRKKMAIRLQEPAFDFLSILNAIKASKFLRGQGDGDRKWTVDFNFIIQSEENYTKILEGKYK